MSRVQTQAGEQVMVEEMKVGEVAALLDREARELLDVSGAEFERRWHAGDYEDADDPRITDLAILLP